MNIAVLPSWKLCDWHLFRHRQWFCYAGNAPALVLSLLDPKLSLNEAEVQASIQQVHLAVKDQASVRATCWNRL